MAKTPEPEAQGERQPRNLAGQPLADLPPVHPLVAARLSALRRNGGGVIGSGAHKAFFTPDTSPETTNETEGTVPASFALPVQEVHPLAREVMDAMAAEAGGEIGTGVVVRQPKRVVEVRGPHGTTIRRPI